MLAAAATCRGSPEWLAHSSATCAGLKSNRAMPPPRRTASPGTASASSASSSETRVAGAVQQSSAAIDDGHRAHVHAVDGVAAHHDGERRRRARADVSLRDSRQW
jgi:hypothetical protein